MKNTWEEIGFFPGDLLLPGEGVSLEDWAVVACDQFTSEPEYWQRVKKRTEGKASAFHLILPEVWLDQTSSRLGQINENMEKYVENKQLVQKVSQGFILVERGISTGKRIGLLGLIDLEKYSYEKGSTSLFRPTEGTVTERIPPRMHIRQAAVLELPHVLLFVDDMHKTFLNPCMKKINRKKPCMIFR